MLSKIGLFGKGIRHVVMPSFFPKSQMMFSGISEQIRGCQDEKKSFIEAIARPDALVDMGDFPDEPLYLVKIGEKVIASIDDWPEGLVIPPEKIVFLHQDASKQMK